MINTIKGTEFNLPGQTKFYKGKVRDVYTVNEDTLVMVASDRISAFDHVLPEGIPYKGQVLSQIAAKFLTATADIVPNWMEATPDPSVTIGKMCDPFMVEMVIRGYLTGHAWREYKAGKRMICGVPMPDGMIENQKFDEPLITPTTKAIIGHDEDISREEILSKGLVSEENYIQLENYGFYHLEKDIANLGAKKFDGQISLRLRAKTNHSKPIYKYSFLVVMKLSKKPTKSDWDLEGGDGRKFPKIIP